MHLEVRFSSSRSSLPELTRLCMSCVAAVFFCTYDTLKRTLPLPSDYAPVTHMVSASIGEIVCASLLAGFFYLLKTSVIYQAACSIRVPTEVIKTRMQTSTYGAAASSFAAAQHVFSAEGVRGFYRGFGSTIMREVRVLFMLRSVILTRRHRFLLLHSSFLCTSC